AGNAWQHRTPLPREAEDALRQEIRALMWEHVGLVRTEAGLRNALQALHELEARCQPVCGEVRNLLTAAHLMTAAALLRRESRGAHFRADYPAGDPRWQHHSLWTARELEAAPGRVVGGAGPG